MLLEIQGAPLINLKTSQLYSDSLVSYCLRYAAYFHRWESEEADETSILAPSLSTKDLDQLVMKQAQITHSTDLSELVRIPKLSTYPEDNDTLIYEKAEHYSVRYILSTVDDPESSCVYKTDFEMAEIALQERTCRTKLLAANMCGRVRGDIECIDKTNMREIWALQEIVSYCERCQAKFSFSHFTSVLLKLTSCLLNACQSLSACRTSKCSELELNVEDIANVIAECEESEGVSDSLTIELKIILEYGCNQAAIRQLLGSIGSNGPRMTDGKYDSSTIETIHIEEALAKARALSKKSQYLQHLIAHADLYRKLRIAVLQERWDDEEDDFAEQSLDDDSGEREERGTVKRYLDMITKSRRSFA